MVGDQVVQSRIFDFEWFPECGFVQSLNLKDWTIGKLDESAFGGQLEIKLFEIGRVQEEP